jgi:hypothetical protein
LSSGSIWTGGVVFALLAAFPAAGESSTATEETLAEFDFVLLGLTVEPDPPSQVVPRNTATGIRIELAFSDVNADAAALLSLLPPGIEVAAELVGPGIEDPVELRGPPGGLLPIPPLVTKGVYLVRDIRLERNGAPFLRATPDSATVEVIERILITEVTTRPLTLEEIRQRGILFGDDNFTGYNFTLALRLDSRPVTIDFPVVFDSNDIPIPLRPSAGLDLEGSTVPLVNTGIVPVLLNVDVPAERQAEILPLLPDIRIPGLIVVPGDVGFLNQFFSAILLVSNGAPLTSGLSVRDLDAEISLPTGGDAVPDTSDDPLVIAETESGGEALVLPIRGLGRDGGPGTSDDTAAFAPGEQGQAEFLLEGRGEGFHEIAFDIRGMLDGLPIGPVPLTGTARGGVLVRNPTFNLTFTAPATVRAGEPFSLFVGVTNISGSPANAVTVRLDPTRISGATLLSGPEEPIETLLASDTEVLEFHFLSSTTGQVTASYLNVEEGTGDLLFRLGVGERGVPLSPDTIVLPKSVEELPAQVVSAALRVLGQAWSVATAPNGTLPEGVARISKQVVLDRATELAEAGFRVQLGEPLDLALESLVFSWTSTADRGFEQILRSTSAGAKFFESVGGALEDPGGIAPFQRNLSLHLAGLSSHVLVGVGDGSGASFLDWTLSDAAGRVLDPGAPGTLANASFLPLSEPPGSGRGVGLVTRLGSSLYDWRFVAAQEGSFDLAVSLPRSDGSIAFHTFSGVDEEGESGRLTLDLLQANPALTLRIDRDGDGVFEDSIAASSSEILTAPPPALLAATVIGPETLTGADPWGRAVALLFDREMREAEVLDTGNFEVEENEVLASSLQLSRRIAFVFLGSPVSDFVEREIEVENLFDTRGRPLPDTTEQIESRLVDMGAIVSGRVLNADGSPVSGAEVLYINSGPVIPIGVSQKATDAFGRYQFDYVRKSPTGSFSIQARDPVSGSVQELSTSVAFDGERIVVDLVLLGRGGVTGVVRDTSGNPIAGARVLVTSETDPSSFALTETDGEGRYVTTGIVVGPLTVKAVHGTSSGVGSGSLQRAGTFTTVNVSVNLTIGSVTGGVFELAQDVQTPVRDIDVYYLIPASGGRELVAATARTDASGAYSFVDVPVPAGDFRILAQDRVRSRQASNQGSFVPGQPLIDNFDLFFIADEFGSVEVTVHGPGGTPIGAGQARVTVSGREMLTDPFGKAMFSDLPPGSYTVSARGAGASQSVFTTASVSPNATAHVNLQIPGAGRLVVTVLDQLGALLPNHPVLRAVGNPCAGVQVTTDANGVAVFEDVPIGNVSVKSMRGFDVASVSTFIQRAGEEKSLILRFAGFGTITGTVLDPNDNPYLGASVVLSSKRLDSHSCDLIQDSAAQQLRTGIDGRFTFQNVPLGAFKVSASEPTFFPVPVSVSDVLRGTADLSLKLMSTMAGELSGTVFLPDGVTPAGPGVRLTVSGAGPDVTVSTNAQGAYAFAPIFPQGRYVLTASDPATGNVARETIFLLENQDLVRNLRLLGRSPVEVTVLKGDGTPIEEAFVELKGAAFPFDVAAGNVTPFDSGRIVFPRISEGSFTVTASDRFSRGGRASGAVTGDGVLARVTVNVSVTGSVTGTFLAPNGIDPIGNAAVVLRQGSTGRLLGSATTSNMPGEIGTFSFDFVPAGPVLATATDPLTGRIGEGAGTIEIEGQVVPLTIRALGLGKISGRVTSGGIGIASAEVEISSSTGLSSSVANLKATATTGALGSFLFAGVPVGSFTIRATLPGTSPLAGSVTGNITEEGQEIEDLEVALEPSGSIVGSVLRPDEVETVPGASLELRPSKGLFRGVANGSGSFEFHFVPTGSFTLEAEEAGGTDAGIASGTLAEGEELSVNVVLNGTGTIEGTALDSGGGPLAFGRVRLTRPAPFARDDTTTVASDGTFAFFGVPVGDYNLSLSVNGSPLRGSATGRIEIDGDVDDPVIQLAPATNVTGVVVKPDGAGGTVPAANVVVTLVGGNVYLSTLTSSTGTLSITGVPEGTVTLKAQDPLTGGFAAASVVVDLPAGPPFDPIDVGTLVLDLEPIRVEAVTPAAGATLVPPDSNVVVTFTDPFSQAEVSGRFFVRSSGVILSGFATLGADGRTLTFDPALPLPPNALVDVFVSKDLADTFGRKLGTDFTSSFATGGAIVTGLVTSQGAPVPGASVILTNASGPSPTVTDGDGRYRFENVAVGPASVVASSGGLSASRVVDIGPTTGVAVADIPIAFASSISGRVYQYDETPAGSGLEVRVLQGSTTVAIATTASDGTFQVNDVPLGAFLVDVRNLATGDRGQRSGTLAIGGASGIDVTLTGLATVRVTVTESSQAVVSGASVVISFTRFGGGTVLNGTTNGNGEAVFGPLLAGSVNVQATDAATGRTASATVTAPAGVETEVDLVLEATGGIEGTVFAPAGPPTTVAGATVRVFRESGNLLKAETTSAPDGTFGFANLASSQSPYRADVLVSGRLRARVRGITVPTNGTASVSAVLAGLGRVQGTVLPPSGQTLSSLVNVTLTSLAPDVGGIVTTSGASGTYVIDDVPVGAFRISARDVVKSFLGEAQGSVLTDGATVTANVQLVNNGFDFNSAASDLHDGNDAQYRVTGSGSLINGTKSLFVASDEPGGVHLEVTVSNSTTRFAASNLGTQEESGRELVTSSANVSGLDVRRKVYVPGTGYFARYLEIFENPSAAVIDFEAQIVTNLNNGVGAPRLVATSSGEIDPLVPETWVVVDDGSNDDPFEANSSTPSTAFILGEIPALAELEPAGVQGGRLRVRYTLSLGPGERLVLLHFVSQELSAEAAQAAAERLVGLPPEALVGLEVDEIEDVVNFEVPDDGTSVVPPLPPLDGRVSGRFLAQDELTEVGAATGASILTARIQSSHILYRRIRETSSSTGTFRYAAGASGSAFPRVSYTLSSTKSYGSLSVSASGSGSFIGPSALHDAPETSVAASSQSSPSTSAALSFDRNLNSFWQPSASDPAARPFLEISLPAAVAVDRIRVTPATTAALDDVQVQLFDASDLEVASVVQTIESTSSVVVSAPGSNVQRIVLSFSGAMIRIAELEAFGITATELGSAFADLVFADSASIATTVTRGGAPVGADLLYMVASQVIAQPLGTNGIFFAAPIPATGTNVTVTATATGPTHDFLKATASIPVSVGQVSDATLELPATSFVSGTMTDFTGAPAARPFTIVADSGPGAGLAANASSAANGHWELQDVPSGSYRVRLVEAGRILFFPFTVSAPAPLDFDVRIPILRDVSVRVLFEREDLAPHPAQNAAVRVQDSSDAVFRNPVFTNASGDALIADVAEGPFTVRITHPTNTASVTDFLATIDAPGPTLALTFTIPSFGTVSGQVRFGDGATAASSAKVEISGTDIPFATVTASPSTGNYSLPNVRAVRPFTVVARHPAAGRAHITTQASGQLPSQGSTFPLNLTLPKTGTVVVTVEEEGGGAVAGASVLIQDSFSSSFRSEGTTNGSGVRSISFVPEGSFAIRVEMGGAFLGEASGVVSAHGQTVPVTVTRPMDATVEGTVFAGDGETPIENALVEILAVPDGSPLADAVFTDVDGLFRFVGAVAPGTSARVVATLAGASVETTVTPSAPGETLIADLEIPVTVLKGRVLEFDGLTPVPDATVIVRLAGTYEQFVATSNPDGSFVFFELPEGTFEILAADSSGLVGRSEGELVDFALERDVLLPEHGTVEVLPLPSGPSVFLTNANVLQRRRAFPDAQGRYRFERVALGSFSVASDAQVLAAEGVGELTASETFVDLDLEIPETGTVSGEVRDSSGDPLLPNFDTFVTLEARKRESADADGSWIVQLAPSSFDGAAFEDGSVPEGEVTVVAQNFALGQTGMVTGTLSAGGTLELNPQLGTAVSFPYVPQPGAPETHEVQFDGVVLGAFDTVAFGDVLFGRVQVNRNNYPFLSAGRLSGSEVVLGPARVSGIHHTRRVLVPAGAPYARIVDVFENPNSVPMEVTVSFESYLSVPGSYTEVPGRYIAGENGDGTAVAVVFGDGIAPPESTGRDFLRFTEEWRRLTILPGQSLTLVHFAVQAPDLATALSRANDLAIAPPISDLPEVLNFEP